MRCKSEPGANRGLPQGSPAGGGGSDRVAGERPNSPFDPSLRFPVLMERPQAQMPGMVVSHDGHFPSGATLIWRIR
jgi:hypothetical protein